jgi:hypothetical protein
MSKPQEPADSIAGLRVGNGPAIIPKYILPQMRLGLEQEQGNVSNLRSYFHHKIAYWL